MYLWCISVSERNIVFWGDNCMNEREIFSTASAHAIVGQGLHSTDVDS